MCSEPQREADLRRFASDGGSDTEDDDMTHDIDPADVAVERRSIGSILHGPRDNEFYVMATRGYPGWLDEELPETPFHRRDKSLAPSSKLMAEYDEDDPWQEWADKFTAEVGRGYIRQRVAELKEDAAAAGKDTLVLSCFESKDEYPKCHVWTILDVLEGEEQSSLSDWG